MTRYLARKTGEDGVTRMVEVTKEEWRGIVAENAGKPVSQKRQFIPDLIPEGTYIDCLVMEAPAEMHRAWDNGRKAAQRNRQAEKKFCIVSLDNPVDEQSGVTYGDNIQSPTEFERQVEGELFIEQLRKVVVQWKFWGPVLLDFYLAGKRRECTHEFAQMLGISDQMARSYKRDFEKLVIRFAQEHSETGIAA